MKQNEFIKLSEKCTKELNGFNLEESFEARLYGRRRSKRNTEKLIKELNK